jgi:hypothetical protein
MEQLPPMDNGYSVVNLGFTFKYFDRAFTQVSISSNGYVCLGNNSACDRLLRPSPYDILVGLNYDLDSRSIESGQIYYKHLASNSSDFKSAKIHLNLFDPEFEPKEIFLITYDNVLPGGWVSSKSSSKTSFQIFLSSSREYVANKSFVTFKFTSCPKDLFLISFRASSGLNYKNSDGILQEYKIVDGEQCTGSNVNQTGVWVNDVTSRG